MSEVEFNIDTAIVEYKKLLEENAELIRRVDDLRDVLSFGGKFPLTFEKIIFSIYGDRVLDKDVTYDIIYTLRIPRDELYEKLCRSKRYVSLLNKAGVDNARKEDIRVNSD